MLNIYTRRGGTEESDFQRERRAECGFGGDARSSHNRRIDEDRALPAGAKCVGGSHDFEGKTVIMKRDPKDKANMGIYFCVAVCRACLGGRKSASPQVMVGWLRSLENSARCKLADVVLADVDEPAKLDFRDYIIAKAKAKLSEHTASAAGH